MLRPLFLAWLFIMAWALLPNQERRGIEANVSPRIANPGQRVLLMVFSDDPDLTCPSIRIEWAEGNTSFQESDCDPADIPETFSFSRRSPGGYGPGNHEIRIVLEQGRRRVVRLAPFLVGGE